MALIRLTLNDLYVSFSAVQFISFHALCYYVRAFIWLLKI